MDVAVAAAAVEEEQRVGFDQRLAASRVAMES